MPLSHRFKLDISIHSVACDILLNDVPLARNYSGARMNYTMPVSDFIMPGNNSITIRTSLEHSAVGMSATHAQATLLASPYSVDDWIPLFSVMTRAAPGEEGEVTREPLETRLGIASPQTSEFDDVIRALKTSRSIALTAEVPSWNWIEAPLIENSPDTRDELRDWYHGYHGAIADGQVDLVYGSLEEKIAELAYAHRISREEMAFEIGLPRRMTQEDLLLTYPDWGETQIELAGHDRLVRLYHPMNGTIIRFIDDVDLRYSFDFWLRRDGSGWRIAR